jgi:hypothetical protein
MFPGGGTKNPSPEQRKRTEYHRTEWMHLTGQFRVTKLLSPKMTAISLANFHSYHHKKREQTIGQKKLVIEAPMIRSVSLLAEGAIASANW